VVAQRVETEKMLEDLLDLEEGLTDWEVCFVEDVSRRPPSEWTARQRQKIEQIAERRL